MKCATLCGYRAVSLCFSGFYEDFLQDGGAELAQVFLGHWAELRLLPAVRKRALHYTFKDINVGKTSIVPPGYYAIATNLHCTDLALDGVRKLSASYLQAPAARA